MRQPTDDRELMLFGASGLVGSSLEAFLKRCGFPSSKIHKIAWSEIGSESILTSQAALKELIYSKLPADCSCDFIFANGVTDPRLPPDKIYYSNLEFPKRVIPALITEGRHRFMTLGTIMENFSDLCRQNSYCNSKLLLSQWIEKYRRETGANEQLLHIRLHTLYGREPKPYMFLGQIFDSLCSHRSFQMTSGEQLREYHHIDDIAESLAEILNQDWRMGTLIELSSGEPIKLVDLARGIFKAFDKENLLEVSQLTQQKGENMSTVFKASPFLKRKREPIEGVIESLKRCL